MRAVVGCAIVSVLLVIGVGSGRAEGQLPVPKFGDSTCEEQCRLDAQRNDSACDTDPLRESDRELCHQSVRARLDVCLRVCAD
jgi:hypothetical protein